MAEIVEVKYYDKAMLPTCSEEVRGVYVIQNTKNAMIVRVETANKYPKVWGFSGNSVYFETLNGDNCRITFNCKFTNSSIMAESSRYCLHIAVWRNRREKKIAIA